jgi:hypothetical protein
LFIVLSFRTAPEKNGSASGVFINNFRSGAECNGEKSLKKAFLIQAPRLYFSNNKNSETSDGWVRLLEDALA